MALPFSLFRDRALEVYNPKQIKLTIGEYAVEGFTSNMITKRKSTENYSIVLGIDGNRAILQNKDNSYALTFSLFQTAFGNKVFLQQQSEIDAGIQASNVNIFTLTDYVLGVSWSGKCVFQGHREIPYNDTMGAIEWSMYCFDVTISTSLNEDDKFGSVEEYLLNKVGSTIKGLGKTITGIFS